MAVVAARLGNLGKNAVAIQPFSSLIGLVSCFCDRISPACPDFSQPLVIQNARLSGEYGLAGRLTTIGRRQPLNLSENVIAHQKS